MKLNVILQRLKAIQQWVSVRGWLLDVPLSRGKKKMCEKGAEGKEKKGKVLGQKCWWAGGMSIPTGDWRRRKPRDTGCICINKHDHQFTLEREQKGQKKLYKHWQKPPLAGNSLGMHTGLLDCGYWPNHWSHHQTALQFLGGTARERLPTSQPSFFPYMLHKCGENNRDPAPCTKTLHRRPVTLGW